MDVAEEKMAFNVRAKASMDEFLRSKSWVEKVKLASEAMQKAMARQGETSSRG